MQSPLGQLATRANSPVPSHRCGPATWGPSARNCNWNDGTAIWLLFNLAIDSSKLRAAISWPCVSMRSANGYAVGRATVRQSKTGRRVRFELTELTRLSLDDYLRHCGRKPGQCLFP